MQISVKINGQDRALQSFKDIEPAIRKAIFEATDMLREQAVQRSPVDTGFLQSSWGQVEEDSGGFSFGSDAPYVNILEEGKYPGVGPKTVRVGGGIYSSQAPGGILTPVLEDSAVMEAYASWIQNRITQLMESM